jgi:transcriptional regulator with PAS, ATPase and Fis domain
LNAIGLDSFESVRGRRLRDVIASNTTYRVLETGERQIGVTYLMQGCTIVSNAYPIYRDGTLIGALEYDVFEDADLLQDFFEKVSSRKGLEHFSNVLSMRKREKYSLDNIKGSGDIIRKLKQDILLSA